MARNQLIILISSLLLLPLAFPSTAAKEDVPTKPVEKTADVVVEGVVYCQGCDRFGTWSLTGAEPIPSAKVSVICKNYRGQVLGQPDSMLQQWKTLHSLPICWFESSIEVFVKRIPGIIHGLFRVCRWINQLVMTGMIYLAQSFQQ
ncbi:hypothetical protein TIFTF001_010468 [Ficus carica]|uniref:Uncharacterized protein n=1 Tax=Ficus carica TaxID=3494 RepID=A0AA88D4J8_FICCA|nr:hypothetical protein TIFTF001_010468 [Ficus carica]